MQRVSSLVEID